MVDLNNFASFPTLAIGLLVAALRDRGHHVQVICPLAYDVPGAQREGCETWIDHVRRRIHLSDLPPVLGMRDLVRTTRERVRERPHPVVVREVSKTLADGPTRSCFRLISTITAPFARSAEWLPAAESPCSWAGRCST
jgi:hypothetical protein